MFSRWKSFLAQHSSAPEESAAYRLAVVTLVMLALVATLEQLEWPSYWWAVLVLTPAASYLSYKRRALPNLELKIALSFAMLLLLFWFFTHLGQSLYDPRIPLAELLVWLQCLHAFDLPAKKDLRYTVVVALILIATAAVLTYSSYFILIILAFCILFLLTTALDLWSDNRKAGATVLKAELGNHAPPKPELGWLAAATIKSFSLTLLAAVVIFLLMPRFKGLSLITLPFSTNLDLRTSLLSKGEIINPHLEQTSQLTSGRAQRYTGDSYFGFNSEVNLNARGRLSERILLKVRTSDWQYHRAVTYSDYSGSGWKPAQDTPNLKKTDAQPFHLTTESSEGERSTTVYYAESDLPNLIFTPANPSALFFPANELYILNSYPKVRSKRANPPATLISPFTLEAGLVYSVINHRPSIALTKLTTSTPREQEDIALDAFSIYLKLPSTVPDRVKTKARHLTLDQTSPWGKATALCAFLQQNYTYSLDTPFYPEGVDTVDYFLFQSRLGYCEQFASALCVLARSIGLPSRYVTGYLPGSYNPFTGFYEIRANDAHAWAEIYIPKAGWVIFDAVPGGNPTPSLRELPQSRWLLESLLDYLKLPSSLKLLLPLTLRALALGLLAYILFVLPLNRKTKKPKPSSSELQRCLASLEDLLGARFPGETVKNWSLRLESERAYELAMLYELTFYQGVPLNFEQERHLKSLASKSRSKDPKLKLIV